MQINPKNLLKLACKAAENAYAPYSKFKVGASALYNDGSIYTGCNVENASYGLTICAERNAISAAVADGKHQGLVAVAIYNPNFDLCYPCGACRQWIAEFSKNAKIFVQDESGNPKEYTIEELLPHTFELEK